MTSIAVIDYGMGNLHSVSKALEHVGGSDLRVHVTSDPGVIRDADRLLFPGVGAIRDCMAEIKRLGVDTLVQEAIKEKPVLAICVGMQSLMEFSEENNGVACIGVFRGDVCHFKEGISESGEHLQVPHMGWNEVKQFRSHAMWQGIPDNSRFYFVHSYYVMPENNDHVVGECTYGKTFASAMAKKNLFAMQFHPEKSQADGLQLLRNFLNWDGSEE